MPLEWLQLYLVLCCQLSEHEAFTTLYHVITQMITWQKTYDYVQEASKAAGWSFEDGEYYPYERRAFQCRAFQGEARIAFGLIRTRSSGIKFWFANEQDIWELAENRCIRGQWNDNGSMRKEGRLSLSPVELVFQIRDMINKKN